MASYDMEASPAPDTKEESKKISFRFCRECSNMLYPKEDNLNNVLMFACRMCPYGEPATATCIYRNALKEEIAETAGNVEDVAQDPTVGDDDDDSFYYGHASGSGHAGGYTYGGASDSASAMDVDMDGEETVPEMCTLCGKAILCPFCNRPSANGVMLETEDPGAAQDPQQEQEQIQKEKRERSQSGAGLLKPSS